MSCRHPKSWLFLSTPNQLVPWDQLLNNLDGSNNCSQSCILILTKIQIIQINGLGQSCSPLVVPGVRGEVGCGYCRRFFIFSFLSSLFCHYILYQQSPTPSIICCYFLIFSSQSFQISLKAVFPSHSQSSSTSLFLHFLGQRCISKK